MEKLIITCAPTGSLTVPTQSPYLPITPEQIADEAVRAAEAGAAAVHIHAREPDGKPTSSIEITRSIVSSIKKRSDVIIGLTTGGGVGMTPEERIAAVPELKLEIASFNMGPISFTADVIVERYKDEDWKYPWEKPYLERLGGFIQQNTWRSLEVFLRTMQENGTKSECECYEVGHIYNIAYLVRRGLIKPPIWMQFVCGAIGGIGAAPEDITYLKSTADRLLGVGNYGWSIIGVGPAAFRAATLAIVMGGHVRIGMEDNVYLARHVLAKSNAEMVEKVKRIAKELGREIATPDEARKMLGLKGKDKVNF